MSKHILLDLAEGHYKVTLHARKRMAERNVTHSDVRACGRSGKIIATDGGKYEVTGFDCDNDSLTLICVEEDGVLIITVF